MFIVHVEKQKNLCIINACLLSSEFWGFLVKSGNWWQVWFRVVCVETAEALLSNPSNQSESSYFSKLTCIIEVWRETYKYPTSPTQPRQLTLTQGTRCKQDCFSFSHSLLLQTQWSCRCSVTVQDTTQKGSFGEFWSCKWCGERADEKSDLLTLRC